MERNRRSVGIVGGGIIGLSTAWRLAQAGLAVCVYEKSMLGREASWAAAGMLSPGGEFDTDTPLARMAIESRDLYRGYVGELSQESGLAIDFQETGALEPAYSTEELESLGARAERQAAIGIPSKRLTAQQILTFWPRLNAKELAGGYFYPGDASVDPREVTAALRVACERHGVSIREQSEVKSVAVSGSSASVDNTPHDAVVIASGAWSAGIPIRGVPSLPSTEPVKGHLLGYRQPQQICYTIVRRNHTYLLQRSNGYFLVGASTENAGFDRSIDERIASELAAKAAALMPHLGETTPSDVWAGFRPASDDLHLGKWHSDRLFLAYGHHRNGILLAPLSAQRLAAEISASLGMH